MQLWTTRARAQKAAIRSMLPSGAVQPSSRRERVKRPGARNTGTTANADGDQQRALSRKALDGAAIRAGDGPRARYNPGGLTAAHRSLPFGTKLEWHPTAAAASVVTVPTVARSCAPLLEPFPKGAAPGHRPDRPRRRPLWWLGSKTSRSYIRKVREADLG